MNPKDFKKVDGYDGLYVTEDGKAYAVREIILSERVEDDGQYKRTTQQYSSEPFHRIMAKTFIPNPKELKEVDHIDGNPMNNTLSNLQWITTEANNAKQSFNPRYRHTGVSYEKDRDKYRGYIYMKENGKKKRYRTGRYDTKEEAANARLDLIKEMKSDILGDFKLN